MRFHVNNWLRPRKLILFTAKNERVSIARLVVLHTGRWPACIESVFYWICGSRIFSLETLLTVTRDAMIHLLALLQAHPVDYGMVALHYIYY